MTAADQAVSPSLSQTEAARAVVAAGHTCEVLRGPDRPRPELVYVDDAGAPLLLLPCGAPRTGPMTLRFRVWPLLGAVEMAVSAEEPVSAERRRRVLNRLLDSHSHCLERHEVPVPARLVALEVLGVRLRVDPDDEADPLEPDEYLAARPCLFRTFGPSLVAHLTRGHQKNLVALARATGLARDPLAVEAVGLDRTSLRLRVVDGSGSREHRVPFPAPLAHPHGLGGALQGLLRHG